MRVFHALQHRTPLVSPSDVLRFSGNTFEQRLASQQSHFCFVPILPGCFFVAVSNFTITGSKTRRGGLSDNEGEEAGREAMLLMFSGRLFGPIVSSRSKIDSVKVCLNI